MQHAHEVAQGVADHRAVFIHKSDDRETQGVVVKARSPPLRFPHIAFVGKWRVIAEEEFLLRVALHRLARGRFQTGEVLAPEREVLLRAESVDLIAFHQKPAPELERTPFGLGLDQSRPFGTPAHFVAVDIGCETTVAKSEPNELHILRACFAGDELDPQGHRTVLRDAAHDFLPRHASLHGIG